MLTADTREELQEQVEAWHACPSHFGFCLNVWKTEYVKACPSQGTVQVGIEHWVKSPSFHYLSFHLQYDSGFDDEVRTQVNAAWVRW